jgi:hypothetical protein
LVYFHIHQPQGDYVHLANFISVTISIFLSVWHKIFSWVQSIYSRRIFVTLSIFFYQCDIKLFSCVQLTYFISIFVTPFDIFLSVCTIKFSFVSSLHILYTHIRYPFWYFSISVWHKNLVLVIQLRYSIRIFVTLSSIFYQCDIKLFFLCAVHIFYTHIRYPFDIFFADTVCL